MFINIWCENCLINIIEDKDSSKFRLNDIIDMNNDCFVVKRKQIDISGNNCDVYCERMDKNE